MKFNDERSLAADLKAGGNYPVYLFYGKDPVRIQTCGQKYLSGISKEDLLIIDGRLDFAVQDIADFLYSMSFFGGKRAVLLDDVDLKNLSKENMDGLLEILADPAEDSRFILTIRTFEGDAEKDSKGKKLIDAAAKTGGVFGFLKPMQGDVVKNASKQASDRAITLEKDLASYLCEICSYDALRIQNEVDKLCAYAKNNKITREDIDELVTPSVEANVFRLSEYIVDGKAEPALSLVADLIFLREDPIMLLSMLSMSFSDITKAKFAMDEGHLPSSDACAKQFSLSAYRIQKAWNVAKKLSRQNLMKACTILGEAEFAAKNEALDARTLLETVVVRLSSICR